MKERGQKRAEEISHPLKKYVFWGVLLLLVILSLYIIKPFLISLVSAFILAYFAKPVYLYLEKRTGKILAALICIFLLIIIIITPIFIVINNLLSQDYSLVEHGTLNVFLTGLSSKPLFQNLGVDFKVMFQRGIDVIISLIGTGISYIPSFFLALLITICGIYFILTNWNLISSHLEKYLPFKNKEKAAKELARITHVIIYGTLFIGFLEAVLAAIGFSLIGIKIALILSLIVFFLVLIGIGPGILFAILALYYILTKNYPVMIEVIILGLFLGIVVDIILRTKIIGKRARINPFIMLLGIIGGIYLFGIAGFIIGPVILSYTIKMIEHGIGQD